MSDDRLKTLHQQIREADKALQDLTKEERSSYREPLSRLGKILAYASVVIEASDPDLLSDTTFNEISNAVAAISANPAASAANAGPRGGAIIDALGLLPVASGRQVEQEIKDAAANFKRSASRHLQGLEADVEATETKAAETKAELEGELATLRQEIADEQTRLAQLGTEQAETFREAQEKRAKADQTRVEELEEEIEAVKEKAQAEIAAQTKEMERVKGEMVDLSGAVALVGTSERYGAEAKHFSGSHPNYASLVAGFHPNSLGPVHN